MLFYTPKTVNLLQNLILFIKHGNYHRFFTFIYIIYNEDTNERFLERSKTRF